MRTLALITVLFASVAFAGARKPAKRRGPYGARSVVERPAEAHGHASLRVRSIDLQRRVVVVEIDGFPRAPAGNLFSFTETGYQIVELTWSPAMVKGPAGAPVTIVEFSDYQ